MSNVELIIKIPEEQYNMILSSDKTAMANCVSKEAMMYAIKNGTSLPKGHGRLIDADMLIKRIVNTPSEVQNKGIPLTDQYAGSAFRQIEILGMCDIAPTIIEADKGVEE